MIRGEFAVQRLAVVVAAEFVDDEAVPLHQQVCSSRGKMNVISNTVFSRRSRPAASNQR